MSKTFDYLCNMGKDYWELKFKSKMYEMTETIEFVKKYKEGCAAIAGATVTIAIIKAFAGNTDK